MSYIHLFFLLFVCSAVGVFLVGVFHYLNSCLSDGLYEESEDEDYNC